MYRKTLLVCVFIITILTCFAQKKSSRHEVDDSKRNFDYNYYFLEGVKNKNLGNYEDAVRNYTMALSKDSMQSSAYYEIASILFASNDFTAAKKYAKKAVDRDKTKNIAYIDLLIYIYDYTHEYDNLIPICKLALNINPRSLEHYMKLSEVYKLLGKNKEALKILDEAEANLGIVDYISLEKVYLYERMGNMDKSFMEMIRLRDAYPTNLRFKAMLAEAYYQHKKNDLAANEYKELESMKINEGLLYLSIAEYHRSVDKTYFTYFDFLEKAFKCEDESLTFELKTNVLYDLMNVAASDQYIIMQIKKLLSIVEQQYPDNLSLPMLKADVALTSKDYLTVQKNLIEILETDKSSFEIWEKLLSLDYYIQDYEALYTHGKEAVELFPNILVTYQYYVVAAYMKRNFDEVISAVNHASMLSVDNESVMIDLLSMQGDAFNAVGKYQQSDSVYEYILYKDNSFESVMNNYSYNMAVRGDNLGRALALSTQLVTLSPENPVYLDTHAWVLYKNKMYDDALIYMNKTLDKDSSKSIYYEHKGDILYKLNRLDEAVESWKIALDKNPENEILKEKITSKILID